MGAAGAQLVSRFFAFTSSDSFQYWCVCCETDATASHRRWERENQETSEDPSGSLLFFRFWSRFSVARALHGLFLRFAIGFVINEHSHGSQHLVLELH